MGLSIFQVGTLGMKSQAHALNTIGSNISNVNTAGYKRTDTRFASLLSSNLRTGAGNGTTISYANQERAHGGVLPKDYQTLDQQGRLIGSENSLDLAISGQGFFQVSPTLTTSNQIYFTRDGGFQVNVAGAKVNATADDNSIIQVEQGYLTDKNGYFLLGASPATDGTFSPTGALAPLRVDQYAFVDNFSATTTSSMYLNLPAAKQFSEASESTTTSVVDSTGKLRNLTTTFSRTPNTNEWIAEFSGDGLTTGNPSPGAAFSITTGTGSGKIMKLDPANRSISIQTELIPDAASPGAFQGLRVGDSISLTGTTAANGTYTIGAISADGGTVTVDTGTPLPGGPETVTAAGGATSTRVVGSPLIFDANGQLTSPATLTAALTWSGGGTNSIAIDLASMTQLNGSFNITDITQNGLASADMNNVSFDAKGHVIGSFSDGSSRIIYKIPLATFTNVNGLEAKSGNIYAESPLSGTSRSVFADTSGIATLSPNTLELSNVELATQFTQMIQVQQAYNSSATVFKTADELIVTARDLK
ncbi:MAG: flagellar hook-basal body complex protein, partial [Alphaproteobacteria bacterium]|nr:flagellar hook-basal body complex protein [Alphaproteobacteria bacterium]